MLPFDSFLGRLMQAVGSLLNGLWRGLLAVLGMAVVLALLVLGFVLSLALIVWALLRGRRPAPVRFRWGAMGQAMASRQARGQAQPHASHTDVVDVEVREITGAASTNDQAPRP